MNVGERYALKWAAPHRLDATITALEEHHVVAQVDHRCGIECELKQMRQTLPIEGELRYTYREFAELYERMADAPALGSGK